MTVKSLLVCCCLVAAVSGAAGADLALMETGAGFVRCRVSFADNETAPAIVRIGIPAGADVQTAVESAVTVPGAAGSDGFDHPVGPAVYSLLRYQRVAGVRVAPRAAGVRYRSIVLRLSFESGTGTVVTGVNDAAFEEQYRALLVNYEQARAFRFRPSTVAPLARTAVAAMPETGPRYRIFITRTGMYRLDRAYLQANGITTAGIDPRTVKVYNRSRQVPVRLTGDTDGSFGADDAIIFYGEPYAAASDGEPQPANVYYLTWGGAPGARMAEDAAGIPWIELLTAPEDASFSEKLHFEEQLIFEREAGAEPVAGGSDYYYWMVVGRQDRTFLYLDIPDADPAALDDSARVTIRLQGITADEDTAADHHFEFYLNGTALGGARWDGRSSIDFVSRPFPSAAIAATDTLAELMILGPKDTPGRVGLEDLAYIDWISVEYRRRYRARDNTLAFSGDTRQGTGTRRYHVDGFTSSAVDLYDAAGRILAGFTMAPTDTAGDTVTYRMSFMDDAADPVRYLALDRDGYLGPDALVRDESSLQPFGSTEGADYVVIANRLFSEAAESLRTYRQAQGLAAAVYYVDDIFRQYAGGVETPQAIKAFLAEAVGTWNIAPAYVVLLGDATYSWGTHPEDYVPTQLVRTPKWGMTASDNWYAAVVGDDPVPDLMLGRLPARSTSDAMGMFRKIVRHERAGFGPWRRDIALFAGGDETKWSDYEVFAGVSEDLPVDAAYRTKKVYTVSLPGLTQYAGGHAEAAAVINDGVPLVNFTGHGGGSVWADKNLLNQSNLVSLTNGERLPVVFSLTCFTGYFDNPGYSSLGEVMLRSATGGAVGFVGASGFGWREGDRYFNTYLFNALFSQGLRTCGAVLNSAKADMHATYPGWDPQIVSQYLLLGDPAVRIALPQDTVMFTMSRPAISGGDSLQVTGAAGVLPGSVFVEVTAPDGSVLDRTVRYAAAGSLRYALAVPAGTPAGRGRIVWYAWNETGDAIGRTAFSVETPLLVRQGTEPAAPVHNDSVYVLADVALDRVDPDSVVCYFKPYGEDDWTAVRMLPVTTGSYRYRTVTGLVRPEVRPEMGRSVSYRITVFYNGGATISTPGTSSYWIQARADLCIRGGSVRIAGAYGSVNLYADLADSGEAPAKDVVVAFYAGAPDSGILLGYDTAATVTADAPVRVSVTLPDTFAGIADIHAFIDPDSLITDSDRGNNIYRQTVEANLFRVERVGGSGGVRFSPDGKAYCVVPDSAVDSAVIANFTSVPADSASIPSGQPDFRAAAVAGETHPAYGISLLDGTQSFGRPVVMGFRYDTSDSGNLTAVRERRLGICRLDEETGFWLRLTDGIDTFTGTDSVVIDRPGVYALLIISDDRQPEVRVTVENQSFADGDYIPRRPSVGVVAEDRNGMPADSLRLFLDGEEVPPQSFSRTVSPGNPNLCLAGFRPDLSPGTHTLAVLAKDNALQSAGNEITVRVAETFDIRFVANHPNPFWNTTIIAYRLTGVADEVTCRIYTAGGRLIRTIRRYGIIDYDEVDWDARDSRGRPVANGTYHLTISARQGDRTVTRRTVMAYMRR